MTKGRTKGRLCGVEDCDRVHYSQGYCSKHYQRNKRYGTPDTVPYRSGITNFTGQKINQLFVMGLAPSQNGKVMWLCRCECWEFTIVASGNLGNGHTKSCGCQNLRSARSPRKYKDLPKLRDMPEMVSFNSARGRCQNPNNPSFERYGGRGVEFRFTDFREFLDHIGYRPTPEHSINRIDNDGHYEIGNVEWATPKEQARNRRSSKFLTHNGTTATYAEWEERTGISQLLLKGRRDRGWCDSCCITIPSQSGTCQHIATAPATVRAAAIVALIQENQK